MLSRFVWLPLLFVLGLFGCAGEPHLLRTGALNQPAVLRTDLFDIEVLYVKAGVAWTNVWMDVRVHSRTNEEQLFDPRELELFSPSLGLNFKHTQRQVITRTPGMITWGDREDAEGQRDWTPPTKVSPRTTIQATLTFETNRNQAEALRSFELVYRGQRLFFQDVRPVEPPKPVASPPKPSEPAASEPPTKPLDTKQLQLPPIIRTEK